MPDPNRARIQMTIQRIAVGLTTSLFIVSLQVWLEELANQLHGFGAGGHVIGMFGPVDRWSIGIALAMGVAGAASLRRPLHAQFVVASAVAVAIQLLVLNSSFIMRSKLLTGPGVEGFLLLDRVHFLVNLALLAAALFLAAYSITRLRAWLRYRNEHALDNADPG